MRACLLALLLAVPTVAAQPAWLDDHRADAERLIEAAMDGEDSYERLAYLTDTFGPRFSGTQALEDAIDWILAEMESDGLENVRGEPVMVPRWVRGNESLTLLEPREASLGILGLGNSIGTPAGGLTGDVLVVKTFRELESRAEEAKGKIVLFNAAFLTYGATVQYRTRGAIEAARVGAIASLVRSVGPRSMYTPHTGNSAYEEGVPRIPHAAVTVEDAMMMQRMQDRGQPVRVRLYMEARHEPDVLSRNVVGEIVGSEFPEQVVVFGGHIDSWDVGTGAMDDAGGCVAAWDALRLMKELGIRPKRTIRVVLWTNEENGLRGANAYRDTHMDALDDHIAAMESDSGVFTPRGFGFTGSDAAFEIVQAIGSLLEPIGSDTITRGGGGADIGPIMREGVPGMGLQVEGREYFWYHHTKADMVDKQTPDDLNRVVATMGVMALTLANLEERLPR
ncbi:MAG: M20/M25/M40 family metallo-hydrolase [Rhodothermales bacterium]|nr:M20/M25/M40 family metallo-hydrolase [Rhodothermales bacterium]MBO6780279.1 M20/M25/M40 family metallo-hydrolase [Rhodothermales bacterium]